MKKLIHQGIYFIITSGLGWIIDFSLYLILSNLFSLEVGVSNMISALCAANFVFFVSIKKNFENHLERCKTWQKYFIYIGYQVVLIGGVSWLAQKIYHIAFEYKILVEYPMLLKVMIKACITPVTILVNFIVMKTISEKL